MRHLMRWLLAMMLLALALPAAAQTQVSDAFRQRADDIVRVIGGEADPAAVFTPDFLAQVPAEQIRAVSAQLTAGSGAVQRIERIDAEGPHAGTIHVGFERMIVRMRMTVTAEAPHLVNFLLTAGSEPRGGDSAEAVITELRSLPGQASFQIARLGEGAPASVAAHQPERALAIGSAFKLVILGELSRQVQEGRRRWSDVVPVERHSLPSGILQDWPLGSPVTLHTLAALMISRSDNTATDVLLRLVGPENVERMMGRMGMAAAARNRPFLTTMEAFQLKSDAPEIRAEWAAADEAGRRRILRERYEEGGASIDLSRIYTVGPTAIDTVEWFASASDMARVMDWLRRNGGDTARSIMAIGPGMAREAAGEYSYVGFKGGSEPGVINLTYLVRNNEGEWYAVAGTWNNTAAAVDEARFLGLMHRAVRLVR